MDRPRLIRGLRIAVSAVSGILCALLLALWVRSYWWDESLNWRFSAMRNLHIGSDEGVLFVGINPASPMTPTYYRDTPGLYSDEHGLIRTPSLLVDSSSYQIGIPYWLMLLVTAFIAIVPWVRWFSRFSLRTLLIATTLIAVLLATATFLRLW